MKGFTEFLNEQSEDNIKKKLKLAMAKAKRKGRQPKVGYHDKKTNKVISGEYQGLIQMHGFTYAKIQEPGKGYMSTVPLPDIRTVNV
tara:strand:+ start:38 stop:298 length:261 start_codon:yes stop_codon:yes gene_type:complete